MHMTWTEVQPAAGTTVWRRKGYNGAGDVFVKMGKFCKALLFLFILQQMYCLPGDQNLLVATVLVSVYLNTFVLEV